MSSIVQAGRRWTERRTLRRVADGWIERGPVHGYGWRAAELTSPHERKLLARAPRGVVRDLSPSNLVGAVPLNRVAQRPHADLLTEIADDRADFERPVSAFGILAVQHLLTEPDGVLYAPPPEPIDPDEVARALVELRDSLGIG